MADTGEVQLHFLDYWRVIKNRWGIITLTFLLVVATAYITTYFVPRGYASAVTIEVKPDSNKFQVFNPDYAGTAGDHFVANQLVILQSKEIIYPVIDELGLTEKWGTGDRKESKEAVYARLQDMMSKTKDIRNTDMLNIIVEGYDPAEAALIANTVARVYQDRRRAEQQKIISQGLLELSAEVEKQRKVWTAAVAEQARIRVAEGIIDPNPDDMSSANDQQNLTQVNVQQTQLNEAKQLLEKLKVQQTQIEKMKPEELMNALTYLGIQDPNISKLMPLYSDTVVQEKTLINSGLGDSHPRLQVVRAQKEEYRKQLTDALEAVKKSLQAQVAVAENAVANEQKNFNDAKGGFVDAGKKNQLYITAKSNAINAKKLLDAAETRLTTESMQLRIQFTPANIWARAEAASNPSSPNVKWWMGIAVIVGLGWGIGLAFFLEYLDTSVKTLADVEKFIGVSVLAVVPKITGLLHKADGGQSPDAETYRTLRTNIEFHKPSPDANTLTVISGGPGEGKSTTLCNLAVICANAGNNVLVVDADLRRPSQHKFFDLDGSVGLVNYVNGEKEFEDVIQQTPVDNLWMIPAGPLTKDPVAILNSHRVVELIERAKQRFDMVMFDSPPILGLSDGAVLSSLVEMTVMVVQHRRFPRASLLRVKQAILNVGGNLVGVVLNRVDTRDDQNYYYYTSYYDYYTPIPNRDNKPRAGAEI